MILGVFSHGIVFDSPKRFHYLAHRGDRVYLVEETLE